MPENPTTESNFETELIQIARSHLNRLQQRYRDNEMQAAVRNWRERMEPVLAMEEEREPFNIRRTIKRIDDCLIDRQVKLFTVFIYYLPVFSPISNPNFRNSTGMN